MNSSGKTYTEADDNAAASTVFGDDNMIAATIVQNAKN